MSNLEASGHIVADELPHGHGHDTDLRPFVATEAKLLVDESLPLAQRFKALFTLKHMGGLSAIKAIAQGFKTNSVLLKHECAYTLGQMQDEQANPMLEAVLKNKNEDPVVRHEAAEGLAAIASRSSIPILEEYSQDSNQDVSESCIIGLKRVQWWNDTQRSELLVRDLYNTVDPAPPASETDAGKLRDMLMDKSACLFERYRAMFALRNLGSTEAVKALSEGFMDGSELFRHEIAFVLGQMTHVDSIPMLSKVLSDTSEQPIVRHEAAEALGSIAHGADARDPCMPVLRKFANDDVLIVKETCSVAVSVSAYFH